jgi:large subunit ribosomal protein L3
MSEIALLGRKLGMTREFYKSGQSVPVTVIKMEKGRIIQVIEQEKRGYKAVQLGFGKIKNSKLTKAMKGFFTKKTLNPKKNYKNLKLQKQKITKKEMNLV